MERVVVPLFASPRSRVLRVNALDRYPNRRAKPAHRTVAERNVAAMRAGDVARDGKAEPGAAFVLVAGIVQPEKRFEHFLAHRKGNTRTVVVDRDRQVTVIAVAGNRNRLTVARRIGDEVTKAALERGRLHRHFRKTMERYG